MQEKNRTPNGYVSANRQPMRSCGKRHAFCKVCAPGKGVQRHKYETQANKDAKYARGYKPHPTKTMWERHAERYGIDPNLHQFPSPHITKTRKEIKEELKEVVEESKLKEGEHYSDYELSRLFGFDRYTIIAFREEERLQRKYEAKEAKRKIREEKNKHVDSREKLILELRLDKMMTLDAIAAQIDPPITRERVRQILQGIERKAGIKIPSYHGRDGQKLPVIFIAVHCKVCGKIIEMTEKKAERWRNRFCDEHVMSQLDYSRYQQDPEYLKIRLNKQAKAKWGYQHDPQRKEQMRAANNKWRARRDVDPVKKAAHKKKFDTYIKGYWLKKKEEKRQARIRPYIDTDGN